MNQLQLDILDALESGRYRQTRGVLRDSSTVCFCAEGVIADVLVSHGFGHWRHDGYYLPREDGIFFSTRVLPRRIEGVDFELFGPGGMAIYTLNDTLELSFPQIASRLREFWGTNAADS